MVNQTTDPSGYQDPCEGDESDSQSDLCAQWTAANGARDAARYARLQLWAAGAGMLGLVITIWLTLRAVRAAQQSVRHAENTAAKELRAWVSARVVAKRIWRDGLAFNFEYDVFFRNHGKTVASSYVQHHRLIFPREDEPFVDAVHAQWAEWKEPVENGRAALMPGEEDLYPGRTNSLMDFLPWGEVREARRLISPIVVISMFYRTDFDDKWHRTDRAFAIFTQGKPPKDQFITDDLTDLKTEDLIAQPVSMSLAT